jgi:hypothetical protein
MSASRPKQIAIASFADIAELVPTAARVLLRHEPDPRRDLTGRPLVVSSGGVANGTTISGGFMEVTSGGSDHAAGGDNLDPAAADVGAARIARSRRGMLPNDLQKR